MQVDVCFVLFFSGLNNEITIYITLFAMLQCTVTKTRHTYCIFSKFMVQRGAKLLSSFILDQLLVGKKADKKA